MNFDNLPSNHFLAQPRPDPLLPRTTGLVDTTTLAAHDFDVDNRTGFMPPQPPLQRLPYAWETWESALDEAVSQKLQLAERVELMDVERRISETQKSKKWREDIQKMPLLPTDELKKSERALRRAHHLLSWLLHFYVQTIPSTEPIIIPRSLSIPLLRVSTQLQLPPVLTYSDDVLYNWDYRNTLYPANSSEIPSLDNIRCQTTFTGTKDEEEFYLTSARIELRGTEALELMRLTMDEAFVGDDIAIRRITGYLERMTVVIKELRSLLLEVKDRVDPDVFYNEIRPWFKGADGDLWGREWVFEGRDEVEGLGVLDELSGASAGQSSLIQALDIFLGVNVQLTHETTMMEEEEGSRLDRKSFQERMRAYMPRHHRIFLNHLLGNPRPLRDLVQKTSEEQGIGCLMLKAFNDAVKALKEFRDAHMIVVTLYIVGPARHAQRRVVVEEEVVSSSIDGAEKDQVLMERAFEGNEKQVLRGTGGTNLVRLLKGIRDRTVDAYLP